MSDFLINPYRGFGGAAAFNPLTDITWAEIHWAEDPSWSNPGNGNPVDSWRDASGNARNFTQSGGPRPTYSSAGLNGRPSITFGGSHFMVTAAFTQAVPYTMVAIGKTSVANIAASNAFFSRSLAATVYCTGGANDYLGSLYAGTAAVDSAAANTNAPRCIVGVVASGTSDVLVVDGVDKTGNAGDGGGTSLASALGSFSAGSANLPLTGDISLVGLYAGDLRSDAQYANFETWASGLYGITFT